MIGIGSKGVDITPDRPVYLRGHAMRTEKSKGVHDRLEAVICWLKVDEQVSLLVNGDVSGWDYAFVHEFRRRVCEKCEVKPEHVVPSATHTHSGPVLWTVDKEYPHDEEVR